MKDILLINALSGLQRIGKLSILNHEELQQIYSYLFTHGEVDYAMELFALTGVRPTEAVATATQKAKLAQGKVGAVLSIQRVTGVTPKFSRTLAARAYASIAKVKGAHLIIAHIIEKLQHVTGTKPSERTVHSWYKVLMSEHAIATIREIEKVTGIPSKYQIEMNFLFGLRSGNFMKSARLYNRYRTKLRKFREIESIFVRLKIPL
jgi:hypothetical protein